MCERCGKPFSDSSSLARHRRIHSGKRPYKCPYADCQKTFTRRTTLTRHQNHHVGTVEEAAAARAAALAARASVGSRSTRSEPDGFSPHHSPLGTPSPHDRNLSLSPSAQLGQMATAVKTEIGGYSMPIPGHLRNEMQPSPRSSPALSSQAYMSMQQAPRSGGAMTSHPTSYGPPSVLEPPPQSHSGQSTNATGSPHISAVSGWQSPSHQGIPSPNPGDAQYVYPEPQYQSQNTMYNYGSSAMRRPNSADPSEHYDPRHNPNWMSQAVQ